MSDAENKKMEENRADRDTVHRAQTHKTTPYIDPQLKRAIEHLEKK